MKIAENLKKVLLIQRKVIIIEVKVYYLERERTQKKMKLRRIAAGLLAVASCGIMLAGCGGNNAANNTTTSDGEAKGGKLIMATEPGFAPYEYIDGSEVAGIDVDIANAIADELGMELEIQQMDFDGALLAVQQGKVDFAAAGISITDERKEVMDFSIEYATSKQVVVVLKDANIISSPSDIKEGTKVAVQQATVADIYVSDDLGMEPLRYTKYVQAAEDLKNNKVDCIIMDELPAKEMVKANDTLAILDEEVFTDKYALAFQKGNTELEDKVNAILEKLIADGKVDEFTLKHTTGDAE